MSSGTGAVTGFPEGGPERQSEPPEVAWGLASLTLPLPVLDGTGAVTGFPEGVPDRLPET